MTGDTLNLIITVFSGLIAALGFVWKHLVIPTKELLKEHKQLKGAVDVIQKEVTTNGGASLKDAVNTLKATCKKIEVTQNVIEQRSKASLHYINQALFETDRNGNLIWTNDKFFKVTGKTLDDVVGYDWITYIDEGYRQKFLEEFKSCIAMGRKLEVDVLSEHGEKIRFVGYPYKVKEDSSHDGFLIHIIKGE